MRRSGKWSSSQVVAVCASLIVAGCSASRQSAPGTYAQAARDTATQASLKNPELAVPQVGEKLPVVPPLRLGKPSVAVGLAATMMGGQAVIDTSESLEPELEERIKQALAECANMARAEVMLRHFKGRRPTAEECEEMVDTDGRGEPVTRAMRLGLEQHRVALQCTDEKLRELKPGGYSLSPRYRYDPATGKAEYIPREVVKELLSQGRGAELRGTLEPDVVIHQGEPHQVQATYDYKFPCVNTDQRSAWRRYPPGRADGIGNQRDLYKRALKVEPARVQPHLGVY